MRSRSLPFIVVAVFALAACAGGGDGAAVPASDPPTTTDTTSTTDTTDATLGTEARVATTTPLLAAVRPFAVERTEVVVEDRSRPTAAAPDRDLPERPTRSLPVLVLAPEGDGPFPVVAFAHGVTASGPLYEPFLARIAEAGYVVVAPTFPLSSGPDGQIFDYVNQPADLYFALGAVDALDARADTERLALAGHSLGAMTAVGAAYHSCCADPRVDAAVLLAGVEPPFPGGDYADRPPTPLLLAHGEADTTITVGGSEGLVATATGPTAFLRFPAAGHTDILLGDAGDLLVASIVAWLDRWLFDDPSGLDALAAAVASSGIASLTVSDG